MEESQEIEKIIDLLNSLSREEQLDIFRIISEHERERETRCHENLRAEK
jgi:hypothetical protein